VAELFLSLSGEHQTLPVSEVKAILEAEGYSYSITERLDQVLRLEADPGCAEALKRRAAFTRLCALELFTCSSEASSIIKATQRARIGAVLRHGESFVVRVKHVKEYSSSIDGMALERTLGALIVDKSPKAKVKLKTPDKTFIGILTEHRFVFGVRLAEIEAKPFVERRPRKKPFFHPSAMQAKLARCMINLAQAKKGETVLDPFCGTGTMLIEAGLIGCETVGLDVQRRMARGTMRNVAHFRVKPVGVNLADAKDLPLNKVDCVVTDPPYGTSSTTLKDRKSTRLNSSHTT
jgi:tRNA (guanine10-N2)-dimethyltransferase